MLQVLSQIQQLSLLQDLDQEALHRYLLDKSFDYTRYAQGAIVHFSGEECHQLEIILAGKVGLEQIDAEGHLAVVTELATGDVLGGGLVFSKKPYYPMMISAKADTTILEIERELAFELLTGNPAFLRRFLAYIGDHASLLGGRLKRNVNKTIRESINDFLDYEQERQQSQTIKLELTKKDMAERFGVYRTSLQRELAKMRDEGLLEFDADSITRLDKAPK